MAASLLTACSWSGGSRSACTRAHRRAKGSRDRGVVTSLTRDNCRAVPSPKGTLVCRTATTQ